MLTRIGMAPRRAGLTTTAFVDHWRSAHADAAGAIPGLRGYVQLHPVLVDGRRPFPYLGVDACSLLDFDTVAEMEAGFASAHYQGAVRADEEQLVDKSGFSVMLTEAARHRPVPDGAVAVATLLRRHVAVPVEEFRAAAAEAWPARTDGAGHEQYWATGGVGTGRYGDAADLLDLRAFGSVGEAVGHVLGEGEGLAEDLRVAGLTLGNARALVRTHRVV